MSGAATPRGRVLWDFDGTLAERPGLWSGCLVEVLDELQPGHGVTREVLRPHLQRGFPWHAPNVEHDHLADAASWWTALHPVFEHAYLFAGVDSALASRAAERVRDVYLRADRWTVHPDSRAALARIEEGGLVNVVVSNHSPDLAGLIERLGLGDHVSGVISSGVLGYEKPHPRIFEAALRIPDRELPTWMIGDNPVADIAAARALGLGAVLVERGATGGERAALDAAEQVLRESEGTCQ